MNKLWRPRTLLAFALLNFPSAAQTSTSSSFNRAPMSESLSWIHGTSRSVAEYDYEMTARVRLLFFWAAKDDVGGGYIRRGVAVNNLREEMLQVLFGSDPAKAPRAINRWGAGTEAVWHKGPVGADGSGDSGGDDVVASTFFGFMKSTTGKSVAEMQDELKKEKSGGAHQFKGVVSQVEIGYARSLVVPLASDQDYTLHQYPDVEQVIPWEANDCGEADARFGRHGRLRASGRISGRGRAVGGWRCARGEFSGRRKYGASKVSLLRLRFAGEHANA
jgi:hypothetical protein